ncbi:MAG: metal ABC transporter permease [Clostridia bacterium]|nr:metal ABC transporter permease [Clostridia bacterium]MDD4387079.1 metal ABC transporter permease [Clostridia bacterium]
MEYIFPFSWSDYTFMKNAFLAILIIAPLFGLVGTMIVNNKMAFFSDALGHSALTGIAIGVVIGLKDPLIAMIAFGILFAYAINRIKGNDNSSNDTIISVFSSTSIAIGLALLSQGGNFSKYSNYLIGDILSINQAELINLIVVFILIVLFWIFFSNKLLLISIDNTLAKSKDVKVKLVENLFIIIIAILVMISIKWVGILIINSLLILPAAASKNISKNIRQYTVFAICFSTISGISGLILSYYNGIATGPTIVIVASIIYFVTLIIKGRR